VGTDHGDVVTATTIAAHAPMFAYLLQMYEPQGGGGAAASAVAADVAQLPRLYAAATLCVFAGRYPHGAGYAHAALDLAKDSRYDGFEPGASTMCAGQAYLFLEPKRSLEIWADTLAQPGVGSCPPAFRCICGRCPW
jgi:hypothetical protein